MTRTMRATLGALICLCVPALATGACRVHVDLTWAHYLKFQSDLEIAADGRIKGSRTGQNRGVWHLVNVTGRVSNAGNTNGDLQLSFALRDERGTHDNLNNAPPQRLALRTNLVDLPYRTSGHTSAAGDSPLRGEAPYQASIRLAACEPERIAEIMRSRQVAAATQQRSRAELNERQRQIKTLQKALSQLGFYAQRIDGLVGRGTRSAMSRWSKSTGEPFDDKISDTDIERVVVAARQRDLAAVVTTAPLQASTPPAFTTTRTEKNTASDTRTTTAPASSRPENALPNASPSIIGNVDDARLYLKDIRAFVETHPDQLDAVQLAGLYLPAEREVNAGRFAQATSRFSKLEKLTHANSAFTEFRAQQTAQRAQALRAEKQTLVSKIQTIVAALKQQIQKDPFAADAFGKSQVAKRFESVSADKELALIKQDVAALDRALRSFGTTAVPAQPKGKLQAIQTLANETRTPRPRPTPTIMIPEFSDLQENDAVFVLHLSPSSPNAYKDLNGKVRFQDKTIVACAPGLKRWNWQLRALFTTALEERFPAHTLRPIANCRGGFDGVDALLVQGIDFSRSKQIPPVSRIRAALDTAQLTRVLSVSTTDLAAEITKRNILSSQYRSDILTGARVGFGALSSKSKSSVMCLAVREALPAHKPSIQAAIDARYFDSGIRTTQRVQVDTETAFKNLQKQHCGVIYAAQPQLTNLLSAAKNAPLTLRVLPIWISTTQIERRSRDLQTERQLQQRVEAQRVAELRRLATQEQTKRAVEANQTAFRQQQLRQRHGPRARSLVSGIDGNLIRISASIDEALSASDSVQSALLQHQFWAPFPAWYAEQRKRGWEFESANATIKDFGVAIWSSRKVDAVIAQVSIMMRNRRLGEYSETCWHIGHIDDKEFSYTRAPLVAKCSTHTAISAWRIENSLESMWDLGVD